MSTIFTSATAILAATIAFATLMSQFYLRRQERILSHDIKKREIALKLDLAHTESQQDRLAGDVDRIRVLESYLQKILQEMPSTVAEQMRIVLGSRSDNGPNLVFNQAESNQELTVREISHAINTPIAQIEAAALVLRDSIVDIEDQDLIRDILDATDLCKAFMGGFRELAAVATSIGWDSHSLTEAVHAGCRMYIRKSGKKPHIIIDLPEEIPGYSNSYTLSILLPLIENAIESSVESGDVIIRYATIGDRIELDVQNTPESLPVDDTIYEPGVSSKGRNHEGLGLYSVKTMVSSRRNGTLSHKVDNDAVVFSIRLPRGNIDRSSDSR